MARPTNPCIPIIAAKRLRHFVSAAYSSCQRAGHVRYVYICHQSFSWKHQREERISINPCKGVSSDVKYCKDHSLWFWSYNLRHMTKYTRGAPITFHCPQNERRWRPWISYIWNDISCGFIFTGHIFVGTANFDNHNLSGIESEVFAINLTQRWEHGCIQEPLSRSFW